MKLLICVGVKEKLNLRNQDERIPPQTFNFDSLLFNFFKIIKGRSVDNDDEVDDIELILSSDDKEYPQEDLVSISYYEPWQLCGQTGTPVLVNFNNISSDNENGDDEIREKLSPSPINHDQFYNAIKENVTQQQLSLESSESISFSDNIRRGYDFNLKSVSVEEDSKEKTGNETELIQNDSFDTFQPVRSSKQ